MVLAATTRADTDVTREGAEVSTTLDARQVVGQGFLIPDRSLIVRMSLEVMKAGERHEGADDESTRAAHARGGWQVAREGNHGSTPIGGEVTRQSSSDGHRVVRPVTPSGADIRVDYKLRMFRANRIDHCYTRGSGADGNKGEAAIRYGEEAMASTVVGMLAEDLNTPGNKVAVYAHHLGEAMGQERFSTYTQLGRVTSTDLCLESVPFNEWKPVIGFFEN